MRDRAVIATLTLLALASGCGCEGARSDDGRSVAAAALEAGNSAYQRGDFQEARTKYREAVQSGLDGAVVLYNLGNAYYQTGELGRAIASYYRAATLSPRDSDVRANLARALAERKIGGPPPPATWLHLLGRRIVGGFTLTEFAVTAAVLYWLALAVAAAMLLRPERSRRLGRLLALLAGLCVIVGAGGFARWWSYHHVHRGVIAEETGEIRSGPEQSFETVQRVQEGSFVQVMRKDGEWLQVVAEGGPKGWVTEASLARGWSWAEGAGL